MWNKNQAKSNQSANPSLEYADERLHHRNIVINSIRSCQFASQTDCDQIHIKTIMTHRKLHEFHVPHLQPSHAMLTITIKAPCNSIFCAVHRHPCGGRKRARAKELRAAAKAEAQMSCRFGLTFDGKLRNFEWQWMFLLDIPSSWISINYCSTVAANLTSKDINYNSWQLPVLRQHATTGLLWNWLLLEQRFRHGRQ